VFQLLQYTKLFSPFSQGNANINLPIDIPNLIGKKFVFEIKINDYNWKEGSQYYTIQKVFDYNPELEDTIKLDHITKVSSVN
jgi:hypothetical protein